MRQIGNWAAANRRAALGNPEPPAPGNEPLASLGVKGKRRTSDASRVVSLHLCFSFFCHSSFLSLLFLFAHRHTHKQKPKLCGQCVKSIPSSSSSSSSSKSPLPLSQEKESKQERKEKKKRYKKNGTAAHGLPSVSSIGSR